MKKIIGFCALILLLTGCKSISYVQLYETASINAKPLDNVYSYENDTLRIDYIFWANKGQMIFKIYNKSARPLYIDWYKSSYISNSSRYQYWTDQTKTVVNFDAVSYKYFSFFPTVSGYTTGGAVATNSKPEKISFIPPQSYIYRVGYPLTNKYYTNWDSNYIQKVEPRFDRPQINTKVSTKKFTKENSPLDFRNFLTFSFKEDFSTEFYIDNEYYVKAITAMDKNHFWNNGPDKDGNFYTITRFKKGIDFYITAY